MNFGTKSESLIGKFIEYYEGPIWNFKTGILKLPKQLNWTFINLIGFLIEVILRNRLLYKAPYFIIKHIDVFVNILIEHTYLLFSFCIIY